jgi:GT2 family glycosyltransferase
LSPETDEGKSMERDSEKLKVSIIVPTYNSGKVFAECLKSIYSQAYPFCEVIIVDNFSSDDTLEIAKSFGAKIVQRKCNPALARNIGVANSTGEYILFIDSDQILSASVIEECVRKCKDEDVEMVKIPEIFIGSGFWSSCSAAWKNSYFEVEKLYKRENIMAGEPRFFVKECIIQVGMLDDSLLWGEDYDLYKRMRTMGLKETSCKSKLYHYEPASINKILIKNLQYGKSMPIFLQQTKKKIYLPMLKHALSTFKEVFKNFKRPSILVGCAFLLFVKTCSTVIGLFIDSLD